MPPDTEPSPSTAVCPALWADVPPVVAAREPEDIGVAGELHDEVGQHLLLLKLELARLARAAGVNDRPAARTRVDTPLPLADAAMSAVWRGAAGLRPAPLHVQGLLPALRQLAHEWCVTATFRVEIGTRLPVGMHNQRDFWLFWAACLVLRVHDHGLSLWRGPEPGRIGLGLPGMPEPAETCGGQMWLYRAKPVDGGCVVKARLPLEVGLLGEVSRKGVVN